MAGAFTAMLVFILLMVAFVFILIAGATSSTPPRPDNVVLSLDLNMEFSDQSAVGGLAAFSQTPGFIDLLTKMRAAETDDSVKGIYVRGAMIGVGSARAEELRKAFHSFRDSGKFIIGHTQGTYGMSGRPLCAR